MEDKVFCIYGIAIAIMTSLVVSLCIALHQYNLARETYCIKKFNNNVIKYNKCIQDNLCKTIKESE